MIVRFRRRTIRDVAPDGSGMVTVWKIPLDPEATDDEDALLRHFRRMSRINPDLVVMLMGTRFGSLILGSVRHTGIPTGRGSLGRWENRVEAKHGRLTPEEYEEKMFKNTPLARRVYRRLNSESDP